MFSKCIYSKYTTPYTMVMCNYAQSRLNAFFTVQVVKGGVLKTPR